MTDAPSTPSTRASLVLATIDELVRELTPGRSPRRIETTAALDRDLGIGSLERVELLLRIEQTCGVTLPDHVMANAVTVADLVTAVDDGVAPSIVQSAEPSEVDQGAGRAAPESVSSLVEALRWHVERTPDRVHLFLREDDGQEYRIDYGTLWAAAASVAAGLHASGVRRGERVALLLRTERAFFHTYFGILLAGAVPVPLYPPFRADQILDYASRQAAIVRNAEARVLVTFERAESVARLLEPLAPTLTSVLTETDLRARGGTYQPAAVQGAEALALIQYTSGSTGNPKGVALTNRNLLANIRAFGQALGVGPDDVGVSWLPLYHDMGLIGMWLGSLYHGLPTVIMSPLAFLSRPSRWLRAFHTHRGTVSAAPNFAFDLCVRKVTADEIEGLDLSSWRAALNGAEAVNAETIERFTTRFRPYGFRPESMCPVYGLAETSLCLTVPEMGRAPRVDRIARADFQAHRRIRSAGEGEPALALVGCGRPIPTTDMRIVDAQGAPVGERVEGRIQFRGPSATAGYFHNEEATRALVEGSWLQTGDLGYWLDGDLYIPGRHQDVIIAGGRNIYPQEIEEAVAGVAGIRRGCVAAFGSFDSSLGTERLVIVAESRERETGARASIEADINRKIVDLIGVPPDTVVLAPPGTIPKTSSGKIRRSTTRELFEGDRLLRGRVGASVQWARLLARNVTWRVARRLATVGWSLFTGYLWMLVGIGALVLRVLLLAARSPEGSGRISQRWCRMLFRLSTFDVQFDRIDESLLDGGAVFVANHASYLDALLVRALLPGRVRMVAKERLVTYPLVGPLIAGSHVLTITRGRESSADQLLALVKAGGTFAIFPEGTFMRTAGLMPFRLGAFRAAVEASRPVIPVALVGTRAAWPDETLIIRRRPLAVRVGPAIWPSGEGWREIVRLRDAAREFLAAQTGEAAFVDHTIDSQARAIGRDDRPPAP
ncbi:MAG: AMP-binding protein [Vicinamibacterales bacterium]